jgi:hypothetical protein
MAVLYSPGPIIRKPIGAEPTALLFLDAVSGVAILIPALRAVRTRPSKS